MFKRIFISAFIIIVGLIIIALRERVAVRWTWNYNREYKPSELKWAKIAAIIFGGVFVVAGVLTLLNVTD
jgi:uncharacterized membrane protein